MPIDVSVPRSPGWWLQREFNIMAAPKRRRRLQQLHDRRRGNPPLPVGAENAREAFEAFQKKARSNFAELIVAAVAERMRCTGFRTALDDDETGDAEVGAMWRAAGMEVTSAEIIDMMLSLSEAYAVVGPISRYTNAPIVSCEDPRFMVGEPDPAEPRELIAALKVRHDDMAGEDQAFLYLPGAATGSGRAEVWVASRKVSVSEWSTVPWVEDRPYPMLSFNPAGWDWDFSLSGQLPHDRIPVVRYDNKDCLSEFETHVDLLDRINQQILQRMVIATMQAFRQRAVSGLPLKDEKGKVIDYSEVFTSDPAAMWQLPETAKMWESGQVDLTPILSAVKDDVQHLAAVTRTPMSWMMPAGDNQSAEGATNQREGLINKTSDRISRTKHPHNKVASLMLLQAGQKARADLTKLESMWAPAEHLSLAERADASMKAVGDIPRRSRLIHIWHFTPEEADRMMSEWADEQLQQQLLAQQIAAATGQNPGLPGAPGGPAGPTATFPASNAAPGTTAADAAAGVAAQGATGPSSVPPGQPGSRTGRAASQPAAA